MPNNYWDNPFGPPDPLSDSSTNYWDDPFGFDTETVYRGLPQDEWTPEYQKSEGWDSLFDNPVTRVVSSAVLQGTSAIFGAGSVALDLFDTATNQREFYTGPLGALVDLPQDKEEELSAFIDKNKQTPLSSAASDIFSDTSSLLGEAASNLSTKKDFGGGILEEIKGDVASGDVVEGIKDVGGFGMDMLAGLGGMAITGGPLTAPKAAGSAIGAGMALDVYGDTYAELTQNENDSRLLAVTAAAANAGVQGVLEKIGWEVAVGKTAFGQWFKDSATASAKRMIGARILLTVPTEGLEEGGQQLSDILARRLPEARSKGWDTVLEEVATDAVEQLPEAMFGGSLGGLLLGGGGASIEALMGRKGAADVAARHGDLPNSPEDKIATAIDVPVSGDKAQGALLDAVEEEGILDHAPVVADPVVETAKKEKVKKLSKKAQAAKDAADQAIKDLAIEQEKQRADLGKDLTSSDIDAAAERITRSIDTVVQEKHTQVDTLMGVVGSMTQLLQGTQPTFNTGAEGEQETVQAPQIQASPEEVSGVILAKAQELGLEVPVEAVQNPIVFDWNAWGQQQVIQAKESVVEGLKGPVDAIRSSISVEPDSPMASVLSSIPEPTVELPEPIYEDESVSSRQLRFERMRNKAKAYEPDVSAMEAALPQGVARGNQVVPGVANKKVVVLPKYEATNSTAKNFPYDNQNHAITSAGRLLGDWLKSQVVGVLGESNLDDSQRNTVIEHTKMAVDSERYALSVMPAMKRVIFNVWQTAPKDLVDRLGRALTYGIDADSKDLAQKVADHLVTQGMFNDVADLVRSDSNSMGKFSAALIQAGKGVMSPWAMERIMLETGVDYRSAKAGVAAMETMSERWAMRNGKDVFEWWDRFGDYARVAEFKRGTTPYGTAQGYSPAEMDKFKKGNWYSEFGKGIVTLFKNKKAPGVRVALHESIHMLFSSGLMYEMLDKEAQSAMEELIGEKLWDANGNPLRISAVGGERMAVGFEKFVYENDAPNQRVRAAFDDVKQWFSNYIKKWLGSLGVSEALAGPAMYASVSVYGREGDPVHLKLGDLDINGPQIRAYYQLLNANPDGTEIAYSAPGIATAVENLITATTGIEAKGVLTYQPPAMSLVTLPVFPNDRVVTADDLPDAEEAANTKWFHGSGKESLHETGLSSVFSKVGLVGTGVYLTDDPQLAETYRKPNFVSTQTDPFATKQGEVYAIKVAPRRVINIERKLPTDAKKSILDAVTKYIDTEFPDIERDDLSSNNKAAQEYRESALEKIHKVKNWVHNNMHYLLDVDQPAIDFIVDVMGIIGRDERLFKIIEKNLRDNGYDAYTHVGGQIMRGKRHRVLVLLDPQSAGETYQKTAIGVWPTVNIDPEQLEDDWSIHEPNGPSDSQWRRMIGLTNDESNGTHTHATLLEMAKNRERVANLSKRTSAQEKYGKSSVRLLNPSDLQSNDIHPNTSARIRESLLVGKSVYRGVKDVGRRASDPGDFGSGTYYSSSSARAASYGKLTTETISLKNPLVLSASEAYDKLTHKYNTINGSEKSRLDAASGLTMELVGLGFDGIASVNVQSGEIEYVVFPKAMKGSGATLPPAPLESRAAVNREVLSAVGEGILEGEPLIEEMFKNLHDTVMNGGMDGHNSGVATDPTKVDQVKDMLTNFVSKMRSWAYLTAKGDIGRVWKELSRGALYALVKPMQVGAKAMEKAIGNYGADWSNLVRGLAKPTEAEIQRLRAAGGEEAVKQRMAEYESMDMLSLSEFLNNNHALSKLADKVAELRPQLYDIVKHMAVPIPGARSFNEITTTFNRMAEAYFAANKHKLPFRDEHEFHEAVTRDLRLWMFSARQFELVDRVKEDMARYEADVAAWEKSTAAKKKKKPKKGEVLQELQPLEKPKKPKLPKITEEGTRWAESVKMLMEMRYGKNLAMFKATAQELTQWENHMVLDKLLNVGMITAKEHADMYSKGKHHIPMYRLRSMLDKSGAINTRLDDSMYKVLDYLKHDISMKMEDPINAMLRKAAGIEMLTMRQHAKNALGKRILADVRWWDIDYKDSPLSILSQKIAITKEEYNELSRTGEFKLTSAVKYRKDDQGNRIESGHTYYKHVPFTAEDVESGLKYATNPSVLKALKKTESQARSEYEHRMFAFYPEPGKPMYVHISDPALQKAFFYMNNQQAVWANSVAGWVFNKIDSMSGAQEQAELQDKFLYHSARLAATGYFGMNRISKSFITAAPAFIYNTLFRDLPGAKIRSRAGLRWIDIPGGFVQSAALMFPSMMEVFPEKFDVARDASHGMATFSGLSASNADGNLDADVLMSLTRGRGEKLAKAKAGHYGALASLMWGDMKQFFAKEGLTTAPGQMWSELKRGKNVGKHFIAMGLSPFTVARAAGQFAGSIIENATRLTERGLMMSEDMSQYPSLVAHYDPKKAINGKILAGTTGTIHRAKWEMAKAKLKMDPNYKVPEDAMPIQSNLTERDNAMSHVTVHFPQKGYWTASMDQLSMFYNPMAQDFYTNMMILARHSALQKATAYALGDNWKAAKDQVKLDSAAYAWVMKSLFYVTLPMLMMMASYGGGDDDSQDWQAQSFIEKSSYFWIPTNKLGLTERPIRVASGLGLFSLMFKDLPMAGMLEMQGKDPKAMHKWMRRFFDSTPFGAVGIPVMDYFKYGWKPAAMSALTKSVPVLAPESVNPVFELMADRQQFRDKAIAFPQELAREDPTEIQREKYNMLTNAITKGFASARMQPAQVQYLISRYFTGSNRWLPVIVNKAMEAVAGADGVPQDVQSSNSPLANQSAGWVPRVQARESYGMGNEFVQDLLSTARESAEQRKSYESMNETRKPGYLAEHKLIQEDIYFGKRGQDGYRSGGLQAAAKKVIEWERNKKEALKAGRIDKVEALLIEKQYTLFAMEAMRNVMFQLGE